MGSVVDDISGAVNSVVSSVSGNSGGGGSGKRSGGGLFRTISPLFGDTLQQGANDAGRGLGDIATSVGRLFGMSPKSNGSLNDLLKQHQANEDSKNMRLQPPAWSTASLGATYGQLQDLGRKRASRTLLTGGQGVLDQPSTASSVLLGV